MTIRAATPPGRPAVVAGFGRTVAFGLVGALGIAVQLAALAALVRVAGLHYLPATAIAVELAVLHNFAWHERWTWADRPAATAARRWRRLAAFHLANGVVSIGGNLVFMVLFVDGAGLGPVAANLCAIAATGVLNFMASDRLVFTAGRDDAASERPA